MSRNVLFIVYYLPPMGSSGVQRPLKFIKYLQEFNWHPIVLAPESGAYHTFDNSLMDELQSANAVVERVEAETPFHKWPSLAKIVNELHSGLKRWIRKLSYGLMIPDNKKGWIKPALRRARELIRQYEIDVVFSTAPPYSNHLIASRIKEELKLPVIMDFRDDWLESQLIEYPTRWHKARMARMERENVKVADALVVLDEYMKERFSARIGSQLPPVHIIPHGYDKADFDRNPDPNLVYEPNKLNLLYSGIFIHHNQPDPFLQAVEWACNREPELANHLKLHFQGGLSKRHQKLIKKMNMTDLVVDYGYLNHDQAVANLLRTDALWLISNFGENHKQVKSGKLFEYLGSGKPILGLVYSGGEEERLLNCYGASYIAQPDKTAEAGRAILNLFEDWRTSRLPEGDMEWVQQYDRRQLTGELASLFTEYADSLNS